MTRLRSLRPRLAALGLAAALATAALLAPPAWARSERTLVYAPARVFPTAVRFLRVDAGLKIVEKDAEAGYVMFELVDGDKVYPGALELVATESAGRQASKLVLTIEGQPSYVEAVMLDKLERKVRQELGEPAPSPPTRDRAAPPETAPPAAR